MSDQDYTKSEMCWLFLSAVQDIVKYWQNQDPETRAEGTAFSILALIDGASGGHPGFKLIPNPHPNVNISGGLHELFGGENGRLSVSGTEHLDKLDRILFGRPAGRNIIGFAVEEIERLRDRVAALEEGK